MKKWILGLSATAAVATPLIAVVSCGTHKEANKQTESTDKPEVVVDHAPTQTGVQPQRPAVLPQEGVATVATPEEIANKAAATDSLVKNAISHFENTLIELQERQNAGVEMRTSIEHKKGENSYTEDDLTAFNNAADLEYQSIIENARQEAHEARVRAEEKLISDAEVVSSEAHTLLRMISSRATYALNSQFKELVEALSTLDDEIQLTSDLDLVKETMARIAKVSSAIKQNLSLAPMVPAVSSAPNAVYEHKAPDYSAEAKEAFAHANDFNAGSFVADFKQALLAKYDANHLTETIGHSWASKSFWATDNLSEVQGFIKSYLIKHFPQLTSKINALPAEAFYYAEPGKDVYGIRFQMLNYLLNDANANAKTFSNFVRGEWDQVGEHHKTQFEGHWIGQTQQGGWDNNNEYDAEIKDLFKAIDAEYFQPLDVKVATLAEMQKHSQTSFNEAIEAFKNQQIENKTEMHASTWINDPSTMKIQLPGINGVKFQLVSAKINATDASKVDCEFTAESTYSLPQIVSKTIEGFKVSNAPSPSEFMTKFKEFLATRKITTIIYDTLTPSRTAFRDFIKTFGISGNLSRFDKVISYQQTGSSTGLIKNLNDVHYLTYSEWLNSTHLSGEYLTAAQEFAKVMDSL